MGCPQFVPILKCLHRYMAVSILVPNELTSEIPYNNGVKQGCILAPTLFAIIFICSCNVHACLLRLAFCRVYHLSLDCALFADYEETLQHSIDSFADAASSFGLTINCNKTEVTGLQNSTVRNPLSVNGTHLAMYIPSNTSAAPSHITAAWTRNSIAESNVQLLLSGVYGIDSVFDEMSCEDQSAITSSLLFGTETWTLYQQRHFVRLQRHFVRLQQRHLRAILRDPYIERIINYEILDSAGVSDIEMIVRRIQLRRAGHVARMSDDRILKQLLFGELTTGRTTVGRPLLR